MKRIKRIPRCHRCGSSLVINSRQKLCYRCLTGRTPVINRTYVIAGNKKIYDFFVKSKCLTWDEAKNYIYVSSDRVLRGVPRNSKVILYEAYNRKDITYLLDYLKACGINPIIDEENAR